MTDGHVQVATDGSGKKIDNAELVREPTTPGGTGVTIERQRTVLGSDIDPRVQALVDGAVGKAYLTVSDRNATEICERLDRIIELLELKS